MAMHQYQLHDAHYGSQPTGWESGKHDPICAKPYIRKINYFSNLHQRIPSFTLFGNQDLDTTRMEIMRYCIYLAGAGQVGLCWAEEAVLQLEQAADLWRRLKEVTPNARKLMIFLVEGMYTDFITHIEHS